MSCSGTQCNDASEARTRGPSLPLSHCTPYSSVCYISQNVKLEDKLLNTQLYAINDCLIRINVGFQDVTVYWYVERTPIWWHNTVVEIGWCLQEFILWTNVYFQFLDEVVPRSPSYGLYISGMTVFKISIYSRKFGFTATREGSRKTWFPNVYPTIYLTKWKF